MAGSSRDDYTGLPTDSFPFRIGKNWIGFTGWTGVEKNPENPLDLFLCSEKFH
jgi:hypothetical protein